MAAGMYPRTAFALAASLAATTGGLSQSLPHATLHRSPPDGCMQRLHRHETDLPLASRTARDRLIANPARIDVVAAAATAADPRRRAEIELGILRAQEWLQCLDPSAYQALGAYISAHASDPVMADLAKAPNAQASVNAAIESSAATQTTNASATESGPVSSPPSFSVATDIVSPSH